MRIGIDGRSLESNPAGIGRYTLELSKRLDKLMPDAEFFLYSRQPLKFNPISDRWIHRHEPNELLRKVKSIAWMEFAAGRLCKEDSLDIFWAAATFWPALLPKHMKVVATVHDINHLVAPETMPGHTLKAYRLFFDRDVRRADIVVTASQGTADRLYAHNQVKAFKIVRPAVSDLFRPQNADVVARIRDRYGLADYPYILALSTLEPRKNLVNLLHAFVALKKAGALAHYKLALVGGGGWKMESLEEVLQEVSGDVVRCGYVPDADLPALYTGASLFVFPSIYEGFGIPALEAVACGTPLLASDIPEIREAAQNQGTFVGVDMNSIRLGLAEAVRAVETGHSKAGELNAIDWETQASLLVEAFSAATIKPARSWV